MNIWIFVLGEPIETDSGNPRMHRAGVLARYLIDSGNKVTLWTSNVDHFKKEQRYKKTHETKINENYKIIELAGRIYKKNISFSRILHNMDVTKEFRRLVDRYDKPDLILTNYPIIELSVAAIEYAKDQNIPSIVDIRDFWPDIFYEVLPNKLQFIGDLIFMPWKKMAKKIVKNVTAVTGISNEAIKWARQKNNQSIQPKDKTFPLAYERDNNFNYDKEFLLKNNLDPKKHKIYCFFGNLSSRYELDTLAASAEKLQSQGYKNIRFVICGSGEMFNFLVEKSITCKLLTVPGWINKDEINTLLEVSKAGILPYPSSLDFKRSYPNKVGEYLSKNLPILSSVQGEMKTLLDKWNCGITYKNKSEESLIESVKFIEDNEDYRKIMSKNAGNCFIEKFDSRVVYKNYVSYIESFHSHER